MKPFAASEEKFAALCTRLSSKEACEMPHAAVEELLQADGTELLRSLFQDHVDLRAVREPVEVSVTGSDGVERSHRRPRSRNLMTLFGAIVVGRVGYGLPGTTSLYPLDAALNLPLELYSHGVRRRAAVETARGSFDEALAALVDTTGAKVPKRQLEELAQRAAVDFDAFYTTAPFEDEVPGDILVLTLDGKGIVMRNEDLREPTRKAAAKRKRKLKKRLTKGEKRCVKRMATVAAVYSIDPYKRTAAQIMGALRPGAEPEKRPRPIAKRVFASIEKPVATVVDEVFAEALRHDPNRAKRWVALVDGNKHQIRLLKAKARKLGVELTIVLDIIHVLEKLWKASLVFNAEASPEAEKWVNKRFKAVLDGKAGLVAGGIRRSATRQRIAPDKREAADACASYLKKYAEFLCYGAYLADGLPIATGVIEGACRHLIKDRMDVTGARWSLLGAEAILRLRSLRSSGDFDEYWAFHLEQEHLRNHARNYAAKGSVLMQPTGPAPVLLDRRSTTREEAA